MRLHGMFEAPFEEVFGRGVTFCVTTKSLHRLLCESESDYWQGSIGLVT